MSNIQGVWDSFEGNDAFCQWNFMKTPHKEVGVW